MLLKNPKAVDGQRRDIQVYIKYLPNTTKHHLNKLVHLYSGYPVLTG